ncbi:NADH-quinone oxidoreductase subunit NuoK, partial [Rhizobium ruizarguesonis]
VVLFVIGAAGVLLRRNILVVLMSLELLLTSVNIHFIAFGRYHADFRGQIFALFVIAITATEVAVALGILVALLRHKST